jgi:hypothetical protein
MLRAGSTCGEQQHAERQATGGVRGIRTLDTGFARITP